MRGNFGDKLLTLSKDNHHQTIGSLIDSFEDKSFAALFIILLALPALPVPTGGITHIFEIIAMLLALELIAGRRAIWLPNKWLNHKLPEKFRTKTLPVIYHWYQKIERLSKPRLSKQLGSSLFSRLIGVTVLVLTLAAFLAPPFSGLDTLPALGIVILSIGVILDDLLLAVLGFIVGTSGIVLILTLGKLVLNFLIIYVKL